ncbi:hypothetical protein UFOVP132_96 [uncultured Caudovirales phage]|uniref:Uncharacterized protein n=1 Tax=uncultured Caudovirales phage TaxID=2100421 RepID=A0A6J5LA45_9CAUD|nr:hypothetical protein UFOVP132_96 [uncultured Caudovirales phage]
MTVTVQNTTVTSTFDYWRNRTNELATAMSTVAVTVNSNTAAGNAAITGTFTANVINVSNGSSNIVISSPTTAQKTSGQYGLNANNSWTYNPTSNGSFTTNGPLIQNVDSFPMTFNAAEYLISVIDNVANNFYASKLLVTHNTSNSFVTEYGSITTNTALGTFSSGANSTAVILRFTPSSTNTTVKFARTLI